MFRRSAKILLAVIIAVCLGSFISLMLTDRTAAEDHTEPLWVVGLDERPLPYVEPDALRMFQSNAAEIPIILVMHSTMSTSFQIQDPLPNERSLRRQLYVTNLLQDFQRSQALLAPILDEARLNGDLLDLQDLWIVNGMALTVRPNLFRQLLESPAVNRIVLDHYRAFLGPKDEAGKAFTVTARLDAGFSWGVESIRASQVWHTFGISGTGAVVAVMDTGVDFLHPALNGNYRGNLGKGLFSHHTSWFDAVNAGVYPYDDQGHGSHVAGTAVGSGNIGVAPGAQWIGVKVLDTYGYGFDSWILKGFQWLLAPGGDTSLAPDIVNASWSSPNGSNTVFEQAVQTLSDSGLFLVFAAGNAGPESASVGAPASYRGVFAVGASDEDDDVAAFSGRGPSPWQEMKPNVVAPGVNILSSVPGGVYASYNGTSMASPHVAGLAAILRGVSRTLPVAVMANIIIETAVPLSVTVPNNVSGWGKIDAFDAVARLINPAILTGNVRDMTGQGLSGATLVARSYAEPGLLAQATADENGHYTLVLNPGIVDLEASAFGFYSRTKWGVDVAAGTPVHADFILQPQPTGIIIGRVFTTNTGQLVTETIRIGLEGTSLTTVTSLSGDYKLVAPQGAYTLAVHEAGYRVAVIDITVPAGEIIIQDIYLTPAPKLLLVDEGLWYYGSERIYWTEALDALRYVYDVLQVKFPHTDTPTESTLLDYDIVLWSSPQGAPGLVGGAEPLEKYLEAGGRLLISGQDVAYFDAGGMWLTGRQAYLYNMMGVTFVGERNIADEIQGQGLFSGLVLPIQGEDSADNQVSPDIVQITNPDVATLPWVYADAAGAGSEAAICTPYRALFFGFGFEAIAGESNRLEVMHRSLDWLTSAPLTTGLTINNINQPVQIGLAGTRITHTLRVRHIGLSGNAEVVTFGADGGNWPYEITPMSTEVAPCESFTVNVVITIPQGLNINATDWLTLTAVSSLSKTSATVSLKSKTPAPVLLVDDDRFYPMEGRYIQALEEAGIFYDIWDNQSNLGGIPDIRSPLTETLYLYPVVIWFTGYDWFDPIVDIETVRLLDYLDQGGRLILSSQDFLYHHESDALARRLGVQAFSDGQDIMVVQGTLHPSSGRWKAIHLDYPFPMYVDIVEPAPTSTIVFRGQVGQPVGIATQQTERPATLFYGFPLEALPVSIRADAISRGVGWLSPLGRSYWQVSPSTGAAGDELKYTLVLRNDDAVAIEASVEHNIPVVQMLQVPSLPPALTYNAGSELLTWNGQLSPGQVLKYVWETRLLSDISVPSYPTVTISLVDWGLKFDRFAQFYGRGPELITSAWVSPAHSDLHTGSAFTLSFLLHNSSDFAANIRASVWMMEGLSPLTMTIPMNDSPHGWNMPLWEGNLEPRATRALTVPLRARVWGGPVRVDALLSDGQGNRWEMPLWLNVIPWRFYLPKITKSQ